jgi:hypothetical protein
MGKSWLGLLLLVWLCTLVSWPSSLRAECPVTATGLCTPGVEETIVIDEVETIQYEADGYTVTTETTTTTTTVTTTNPDSGDILDGDAGYVSSSKYEGDMDVDWGGQGPATMPSGSGCYNLGTDKCAQITGSGNSTSTMGVSGMGTTFINTVDISDLDIENGGRTNYSIKVDKRDSQDRIYMHITGKNGNTSVFSGTDILSESGVASGYQTYENGFDFAGTITKLIIEVGGRDINLAIGPLFDDIQINVLYNVVSTIVTEHILSVEMWVAYGGSTETEVIDIVENIFEHNDVTVDGPGDDFYFEPEFDEPNMDMSYETVEIEMDFEIEMPEMEMADIEMELETQIQEIELDDLDMEMPEMEMAEVDMEMPEPEMEEVEMETTEPEPEMETEEVQDEPMEEATEEPQEDMAEEPEPEESASETTEDEAEEEVEEKQEKPEKKEDTKKPESKKEKAAKKIVKKMGDKGRYDSTNQLKTLIVMQVLGDTKTFFESQKELNDREGFFTEFMLPDTQIENNNLAQYYLFAGSEGLINEMIDSQWQQK